METVTEHALLTAVVLQVLFSFKFSLEDIRRFRLVCKTWYEMTLKQWRRKATVQLGPVMYNKLLHHSHSNILRKQLSITRYFQLIQTTNDFYQFARYPFKKYILKGIDFRPPRKLRLFKSRKDNDILVNSTFNNCWNVIGPLMINLQFNNCTFDGSQCNVFERILAEKLVNLESLSVYECNSFPERENEFFDDGYLDYDTVYQLCTNKNLNLKQVEIVGWLPTDLSVLLFSSPNLELLKICGGEYSFSTDWSQLYSNLANICETKLNTDQTPFKIKELQFSGKYLNVASIPTFLRTLELPVERVFLNVSKCSSDMLIFPTGMYNPNTLTHLEICSLERRPDFFSFTMEGTRLKEFYLYGLSVFNFSCLNEFHSLEKIFIDSNLYNSIDRLTEATGNPKHLANFMNRYSPVDFSVYITGSADNLVLMNAVSFLHVDFHLEAGTWSLVSKLMPNLQTLKTVLYPVDFEAVCEHLKDLQELVLLHGSKISDRVLTGWSPRQQDPCNITALKNLKKFVVQRFCGKISKTPPPNCRLGNLSVYRGFLKMESLEQVIIHASRKMTPKAETDLKHHIKDVEVIRTYKPHPHGNEECCKIINFLTKFK